MSEQVRTCSKKGCKREARKGEFWCNKCYANAMKKVYRRKKLEEAARRRRERNESWGGSFNLS